MYKLTTVLALATVISTSAYAATSVTVNQDDALSNIAVELAVSACPPGRVQKFLDSANGAYTATMSSKEFPSGLKSVSIVLESETVRLAVVKPYAPAGSDMPVELRCVPGLKRLSSPN